MTEALLCIEVLIPAPHPVLEEAIEASLWDLGAQGVERQDDTTFSRLYEDPRPKPAGSIRWRVFLPLPEDPAATEAEFEALLGEVAGVSSWILDDLSFMTRWREFFRPTLVSPRIMVHPPWDVPELPPGVVPVEIEPGMAFGTGTHETTRLCLAALDRLIGNNSPSVLDVGCGSGILSIAAARLGAEPVRALDNDPDAVVIANENYGLNHVQVRAEVRSLEPALGEFDIVVANILPHVLIALRDGLLANTRAGGTLLLSGIIDGKEEEVIQSFTERGARLTRKDAQGEWWSVELEKA